MLKIQKKYILDPIKEGKKYCHLNELYHILPELRKDIRRTLNNFTYSKQDIIYLILAIIDLCNFRIGNDKYKKSTGTATLKVNHIQQCNSKQSNSKQSNSKENDCNAISFIGKRGVLNQCDILHNKINHILMNLTEYKNDNDFIFTYQDSNENIHKITAQDVNELLHKYGNISTKMFRTWKANYYFIKNIKQLDIPETQTQIKKNISEAVGITAEKLHHTKAICRRSYIDSRIVNFYKQNPIEFLDKISNTSNSNPYLLDGEEDLHFLISQECSI